MKFYFVLGLIILLVSCKKHKLEIRPLHPYIQKGRWEQTDSVSSKFYFMKEFSNYDKDSILLDDFVRKNIDSNYAKYYQYEVMFFKGDDRANETFRATPNEGVGACRLLVMYIWQRGKFFQCMDNSTVPITSYFKKGSPLFNSEMKTDVIKFDSANMKQEVELQDTLEKNP